MENQPNQDSAECYTFGSTADSTADFIWLQANRVIHNVTEVRAQRYKNAGTADSTADQIWYHADKIICNVTGKQKMSDAVILE